MHRSGTSFCVRALQRHGVLLPPNLLTPAADNPDGFQESADLVALNDAWLAGSDAAWDSTWSLRLQQPCTTPEPDPGLARESQRLLKGWCRPGSGPALALKDPRLCRTLPQLAQALSPHWLQFGLAVVRNPAAVVASIGYRDDMPALKALALWLRHNLELVEHRRLTPAVAQWPLVSFERLITNPEQELAGSVRAWQQAGLHLHTSADSELPIRELPTPPSQLEDVPAEWLAIAKALYQAMVQANTLGDIPESALAPVRALLDGTPALSQQLLALEAQRRLQLGEQLARERRGRSDPGLLGEDDLNQQEHQPTAAANTDCPPYVQLHQVCVDLRGRDQRRSLRRMLLQRQGPSGLRPLALDQLNLRVDPGERIGLLGHNGSGKTTLLRLLSAIYSPTGGRIERQGPALAPVIEQSLGFSQELSGLQLARYSHKLHRAGLQSWDDYLAEISAFTELGDALATPIKTWSLGMRTRLSFALITFRAVQGLALDEGLAAGDQWFQRKARRHLDQFIDQAGTLVLASHSEDLLRRYCSRGVILERGRVRYDGSLYRALQLYRGQLH